MKFVKSVVLMVALLVMGLMEARMASAPSATSITTRTTEPNRGIPGVMPGPPADLPPALPEPEVPFMPQVDISKLPAPLNAPKAGQRLSMDVYAKNKVADLQQSFVNDIFPKKDSIEQVVNDFKAEYPGPNKAMDSKMIYDAIIKNPEIKKHLTLENAPRVYHFIQEAISKAWDKQDEIVWSR